MFTLVTGGSGSGKSSYAEKILSSYTGTKYYLATMKIYDEEGEKKVMRHRKLREGKGFITIESPIDAACIEFKDNEDAQHKSLLLECMSNLTANEMFKEKEIAGKEEVVSKIIYDMEVLLEKTENLIVVTNNVFEDGVIYDKDTMQYLEALAQINIKLAGMADRVVEVVAGIPVEIK